MKRVEILLVSVLLVNMLVSGCGIQKEVTNAPQSAASNTQSQKVESPTASLPATPSTTNTPATDTPKASPDLQPAKPKVAVNEKASDKKAANITKQSTVQTQANPIVPAKKAQDSKQPASNPEKPKKKPPSNTSNTNDFLVIQEKMFLTQIDEIYFNFENYKDKTIVVEGMFTYLFNEEGVQNVPAVYRNGPGCCGNDGWGGFLLKYDKEYPQENAWIKVTGTPEMVDGKYVKELYLNVLSIEVLEKRGAEFVSQ